MLIIDQLGCISIAASRMHIYKEIMGMFVEINLQAASATYAKGKLFPHSCWLNLLLVLRLTYIDISAAFLPVFVSF